MKRLQALAVPALALAVAAPASAITGWGASKALRAPGVLTSATKTSSSAKSHTCQAERKDKKTPHAKLKVIGGPKSTAVVACEQPPRSEPLSSTLKSSPLAALSTIG